jgi:hypothetical protein
MININDVVVPTKGTAKYLNVKVTSFDLSPSNGVSLTWSIHKEDIVQDPSEDAEDGDTISVPGKSILSGTLNFPQTNYDTWGTDDTVVSDWVLTQLGFTEVS